MYWVPKGQAPRDFRRETLRQKDRVAYDCRKAKLQVIVDHRHRLLLILRRSEHFPEASVAFKIVAIAHDGRGLRRNARKGLKGGGIL